MWCWNTNNGFVFLIAGTFPHKFLCSSACWCVQCHVWSLSRTSGWGSAMSLSCSLTGPTAIWLSASVFLLQKVITHENRCSPALWQGSPWFTCPDHSVCFKGSVNGCELSWKLSSVILKMTVWRRVKGQTSLWWYVNCYVPIPCYCTYKLHTVCTI